MYDVEFYEVKGNVWSLFAVDIKWELMMQQSKLKTVD